MFDWKDLLNPFSPFNPLNPFNRINFFTVPSLNEFLVKNPTIRSAIEFQVRTGRFDFSIDPSLMLKYDAWPAEDKSRLENLFKDRWKSLIYRIPRHSIFKPVFEFKDSINYPPINLDPNLADDHAKPTMIVSESYAKEMFFHWLALNLVIGVGQFMNRRKNNFNMGFPLHDLSSYELGLLLSSKSLLRRKSNGLYYLNKGFVSNSSHYHDFDTNVGSNCIAPPGYTYSFLKNNEIIAATRKKTILNLLRYCRDNLRHYGYSDLSHPFFHYHTTEDFWNTRSIPLITSMIEGVEHPNPIFSYGRHWAMGCWGTIGFLKDVLRAVNIPVEIRRVCSHATAFFPTEGLFLDHGDNPYSSSVINSTKDVDFLLRNISEYDYYFSNVTGNSYLPQFCEPSSNPLNPIGKAIRENYP